MGREYEHLGHAPGEQAEDEGLDGRRVHWQGHDDECGHHRAVVVLYPPLPNAGSIQLQPPPPHISPLALPLLTALLWPLLTALFRLLRSSEPYCDSFLY